MNFTTEMLKKAKTAASIAELQKIAKEFNIELTEDEATKYFNYLKDNNEKDAGGMQELSSDELDMLSGGKGKPEPQYKVGQRLGIKFSSTHSCLEVVVKGYNRYDSKLGWEYIVSPLNSDGTMTFYLETREAHRVRTR